ncbi:MAG: TlpA family protein disulfide reductase [Actinomycetota bacterium]|nr:TlpA family protein disulfide reductase [Actinomycetota bacterium]
MATVRTGRRPPSTPPVAAAPRSRRPRPRRLVRLGLAVAALAVLGAALALGGEGEPNRPAPAFSLGDVRGGDRPVALAQRGGKPAVLNFFASWCVPCRKELPVLERAHRREADRVAFLGVAVDDSRSAARGMLDEAGVTYPAGLDPDKAVAGRYRLRGMPTTVFIGGDGRVLGQVEGALSPAELERWLGRLEDAR